MTFEERFWAKVEKTENCWLWTGCADKGYGRFYLGWWDGKRHHASAPRVSWEMAYGPIPPELYVLHHCDTPGCVRPDHLFLGTAADNWHDAIAKGRIPRGENHWARREPERAGRAKLTVDDVREIRRRLALGEPQRSLGRAFNVTKSMIGHIHHRRSWTHI